MPSGAPWADLPARYPSYQTCHRRFQQQWVRAGALRSILEILAQALHDEDYLDLQEAFIDASFAPAKRRRVRGRNETRQRVEDHGDRRSARAPGRRPRRACYAA